MTQSQALDILKLGHNVYLTGPAGSGKTYLLNQYISYLKSKKVEVGVTASTGIAATHLDGRTIHSWAGLGIMEELKPGDIEQILKNKLRSIIISAGVLIIDEISMLHANQLDMVDTICRAARENDHSFGGIQVVLSGDFFQLPPVAKDNKIKKFVPESVAWNTMGIKICYLHEQFRQEDTLFLDMLNEVRANQVTEQTVKQLRERYQQSVSGVPAPTKLYTHNRDVDAINQRELAKIDELEMEYIMTSKGPDYLVKSLKRGCLAPEQLTLKKGAIVMFVKNNFNKGYVNGTLGTVIDFDEDDDYPIVKTKSGQTIIVQPESWEIKEDDIVIAQISQIPLRLAWAFTVHKSQGMSLDAAEIDLSKTFELGMGYVALSRVRSLDSIKLTGINDLALQVNSNIVEFDKNLQTISGEVVNELELMSKRDKKHKQDQFIKPLANRAKKNSLSSMVGKYFNQPPDELEPPVD